MGSPPPHRNHSGGFGGPSYPSPQSLSKEGCRGGPPDTKVGMWVLQTPPPSNEEWRSGLWGPPPHRRHSGGFGGPSFPPPQSPSKGVQGGSPLY